MALLLLIVVVAATGIVSSDTRESPPLDLVTLDSGLRVMRHEVSIAQWQLCHRDGACRHMPKPGRGATDGSFPVTDINAFDVDEFVAWARKNYHPNLRLPTTEEWHGFAGFENTAKKKLFTDPRMAWAADYGLEKKENPTLQPPGHFGANKTGIADLHGNVWEWTASCVSSGLANNCPAYTVEGEHTSIVSAFVRDPALGGCASGTPPAHLGLRLVVEP